MWTLIGMASASGRCEPGGSWDGVALALFCVGLGLLATGCRLLNRAPDLRREAAARGY